MHEIRKCLILELTAYIFVNRASVTFYILGRQYNKIKIKIHNCHFRTYVYIQHKLGSRLNCQMFYGNLAEGWFRVLPLFKSS
jgi:hypothetical protein